MLPRLILDACFFIADRSRNLGCACCPQAKLLVMKGVTMRIMLISLSMMAITLGEDTLANPPIKDTHAGDMDIKDTRIAGCPVRSPGDFLNRGNEGTRTGDMHAGDTRVGETKTACSRRYPSHKAPDNSFARVPSEHFHEGKGNCQVCDTRVSGASLSGMDVSGMDVSGANVSGASVSGTRILVFVSFSMPESSLKSLGEEAMRDSQTLFRPILVMRGLYRDSFVKTAEKLKDLGVSVDINPELFETHHITTVPTFVLLKDGKPLHRLKGNVTLAFARETFASQQEGGKP